MKFKKITLAGAAALAVMGLASCGDSASKVNEEVVRNTDSYVYDANLMDFKTTYDKIRNNMDMDDRVVGMAEAEAKLLSSGVFLPTTTRGGNYAMTNIAPKTAPTTLWGTDEYRLKNLVISEDKLTVTERNEMKAEWEAKKGTDGFDYEAYCKQYLKSKGHNLKTTYDYLYTADTATFDILNTSMAADSEILMNSIDGLLEYDVENVQQNAIAESYEVSEDGKTYTFHLKHGVKWSTVQGTEYAEVKADDFVAGFQHLLDCEAGLEWLVDGLIVGVSGYLGGDKDFSKVGVKAVDDYTVTYTLENKTPYFTTLFGYTLFLPMNRAYFTSKGGEFGEKFDATAENYSYGKSQNDILYNGAYIFEKYDSQSSYSLVKNNNYYDADNVEITKMNFVYSDGSDPLFGYNAFNKGDIDGCGLNTTAVTQAKKDDLFDNYAYTTDTDATTYFLGYNLNRKTYQLENGAVKSNKSYDQKELTVKALSNKNFRLALSAAFDKATWNAQSVGDELKNNSLRNTYTPYNFVQLSEARTATVNGETKTYAAGTAYGTILADYMKEEGLDWVNINDGVNGWYNVEKAKEYYDAAMEEMGCTQTIYIDIFYYSASQVQTNQVNAYKNSIESALDKKVIVNLVEAKTTDDYYASGYRAANGAAANYDVFYGSGWDPDYGDTSTYLDTFLGDGLGYMTKVIGLF